MGGRPQLDSAPFDVAKVDVYKQLQRRMTNGLTPVMELQAEDGASASNTPITVFGTDRKDLTKLGTVRREIHVALLDPKTHAQSLYPATILQSGLTPRRAASRSRPGGTPTGRGSSYRYCSRRGRWTRRVLSAAEYFVTVRLGALEVGLVAEEVRPLLARLDAEAREQPFGRREVKVGGRWWRLTSPRRAS